MGGAWHTTEASSRIIKYAGAISCKIMLLMIVALLLQACSMTARDLDEAVVGAIAIAEPTATVSPDPFRRPEDADGAERDRLLDEDTIRNAVTSANIENLDGAPLSWANQSTGAAGTITDIRQRKMSGQTCRSFTATRNSYDGVSLYKGEVCLDRRTGWWTRVLETARTLAPG